ncbi:hypothetical protein B0H14DRAFT_2578185 [Mycena olivaceomarginata]|nr:hypothetical protein B0H14DRAFT_2578185 [Mycena olivaceomarginata]
MTGKREGHPCCGLHMSDEGVGGAGGKTGYPLLHSYWIVFDRVGVWIKLTLVKQHREEGGAGGSSCCRLHSGCWRCWRNRLGRYTGVHLMEMELQEGGRHNEHPLLQATLLSEVLEAEQPSSTGRQEVQGTPTSKAITELQWWECIGNCRE